MFERILLVLDGTRVAEIAIPYAVELSSSVGSRLHLIHLRKSAEQGDQSYLKQASAGIDLGPTKLKTAEVIGDAATGIINYTRQNKIDLIVMAMHSRTGIMLFPIGNIATKVLEGVTVPLLSIKAGTVTASGECPLCRILAPLDGSKVGETALPYAAELAKRLSAELVLFQVVEPGQHVHTLGGLQYVNLFPEQVDRLVAQGKAYLEGVAKTLTGIERLRIEVKAGHTERDIHNFAKEINADVIALSTCGAGTKGNFGAVFRKVLQAGRTHILAVRPEHASTITSA